MNKILTLIVLFSSLIFAEILPENVMLKSCLNRYNTGYKSLKTHKAFSYAREEKTGKERCGWNYGYDTLEEAKREAMQYCTQYNLNATCHIIDEDGKFLVKKGDYSFITPPDDTPLTREEKKSLISKAKPLILGNCLPFFKEYLEDKGYKAFAYSLDADGKYACGKTYQNNTRIIAREGAIKGCQENKAKRGKNMPKDSCKLYAEANKILLQAEDFGIKKGKEDYEQALHKGNMAKVKEYIADGFDVNLVTKKEHVSPLFLAATQADKAFFFELIEKGANVNQKAKDGSTLLHAAALGGDPAIIRYLLKKGFDVNAKGVAGMTPLHAAFSSMHTYAVRILMQHGADATIKNDKGVSFYEIAKNWKLDLDSYKKLDPNKADEDGVLPLYFAVKEGDREGIKELLKLKANINHLDERNYSALHIGKVEDFEFLMKLGAKVNAKDIDGVTPLMRAANWGFDLDEMYKRVESLLSAGADKKVTDNDGETAYDRIKDDKRDKSKKLKDLLRP